jgi:endo-1,4-beta-xylanase
VFLSLLFYIYFPSLSADVFLRVSGNTRILTYPSPSLDSATYAKTKGMISKVQGWKSKGAPINGIGSQTHLSQGQASGVSAALSSLCAVVDECAITELDIAGAPANDYTTVFNACKGVKNCVGITVWGVRDSDSWRSQNSPLLFDGSWNPKQAYTSICNAL